MKIKTTLKALAIALQVLVLLSSTVSSGDTRHPDNLVDLVERSGYAYDKLIEWLNITGVASSLGINLSSFEDVIDKSPRILEKIYNNATLAMFIGGLQLRQLKIFARISSDIKSDDVVNLLKTVALGLNISRIHLNCGDTFSKVFLNLAHPGRCGYSTSDVDAVLQYVILLGKGLPREYLASVLSKVYAMRIALQVKEVGEDVLNKVLTDLLYEDSLVLYIVFSDIVKTSGIRIVPVQTSTPAITSITMHITSSIEASGTGITLSDFEKALSIIIELISLAEKYGVTISAEDVMAIVSYVLSVDIEKVTLAIQSLDIEDIKRLEDAISIIGRERVKIGVEDILLLEGMGSFGIPIIPIVNITIPLKGLNNTKTGTASPRYIYDEVYGENLEVTEIAIDIDSYINSKRMLFPNVLAPTLYKVNIPSISLAQYPANNSTTTTYPRQIRAHIRIDQSTDRGDLLLYLALFVSTIMGVAAILRPRWFLLTIARIAKMFKSGGGFISSTLRSRSIFDFFWVLVHKLAQKLEVEIQGSDTHREIYNKIAPKIRDSMLRTTLKDVVKGYEVLRYSDKPTVDENLWLRSVKDLIDKYE